MKQCLPVLHSITSFKGAYKKLEDTARSSFVSCCFNSAFTSAVITVYNFSELRLALSEKIFSSKIFLFQQIHPEPFNGQNLLSVMKNFCQYSQIFL